MQQRGYERRRYGKLDCNFGESEWNNMHTKNDIGALLFSPSSSECILNNNLSQSIPSIRGLFKKSAHLQGRKANK